MAFFFWRLEIPCWLGSMNAEVCVAENLEKIFFLCPEQSKREHNFQLLICNHSWTLSRGAICRLNSSLLGGTNVSVPHTELMFIYITCQMDCHCCGQQFLTELWFLDLVTSIHENWFCARCVNSTKSGGEGVIVMQIGAYLLVSMYVPFLQLPIHGKWLSYFLTYFYLNCVLHKKLFIHTNLLMYRYDGSLPSASQAMVAADQFAIQFNRRSH